MTRLMLIATLVIAVAQPGWAAAKKPKVVCTPANAVEAQQAIRYMTELGVATNACSSIGIYADFRTRNHDAIIDYQKVLIAHFKGAAAFDKWNTSLANAVAQKQSGVAPMQFCEHAMPMLEQAKTLDIKAYKAYAAAQAAADTLTVKCAK